MEQADKRRRFVLGAAHFLVDLTCTALLTAAAGEMTYWQVTACAVLYNGLAFAFQLPIGALADGMDWKSGLAALGCLLAIAVILLQHYSNDTIKDTDDVEHYLGLNVLASIPTNEPATKKKKRGGRK